MAYLRRYFKFFIILLAVILLTACGGKNQLTYQVSGSAGEAEITYTDSDGSTQTDTVALPWELSFKVGSEAEFSLSASSATDQDGISCAVLLDDEELGSAAAARYAGCEGSFRKSGGSLSTNFSSSKDVLPDGSPAVAAATEAPLPEPTTPEPTVPEPTVPPPATDITAEFVPFTNKDGTVSLSHPPGWQTAEQGSGTIAVVSGEAVLVTLFEEEDFSKPAGFVMGEIWLTSDIGSDDPIVIHGDWVENVDEDWAIETAGELDVSENDGVRQVSRDYIGTKEGHNLYFTIMAMVNGGRVGLFIGGRTSVAPEDDGILAAAVMDSIEIQYIAEDFDPADAKPTVEVLVTQAPASGGTDDVLVDGQIVFASERDGNSEIYLVNTDGSGLTRLTDNAAFDGQPAWSPDGTKIIFASDRDGKSEIYTMNPDGSDMTNLTNDPASDHSPAWAPNAELVAFVSDRGGSPDIFLMKADGSEVTPFIANDNINMSPAWSPVSPELAFVSNQTGNFELYVIDNNENVRHLTEGLGDVFSPHWSPNGVFITFAAGESTNSDIYIINPDGSNLLQVTTDEARDYQPKWSPDSTYILFVSERFGNAEICVIDEAGDLLRVTQHDSSDLSPDWAPWQ